MRTTALVAITGLLGFCCGCNRANPFLGAQNPYSGAPAYAWQGQTQPGTEPSQLARLSDLNQRAGRLDADNADLHKHVAQSQQQVQVLTEQVNLLRKQLSETTVQARELQKARDQAEQKLEGLLASTRQHGGATLRANNSLRERLKPIELPGLNVRTEDDVLRVEVPADQLFNQGTAQFLPGAPALLTQLADAIRRNFPRQRIVVEGHTSSSPSGGSFEASNHRLAAAQALAVIDQLTTTGNLPPSQLSAMALGANHPLADNDTPGGRARNRRIEVVIYPESIDE